MFYNLNIRFSELKFNLSNVFNYGPAFLFSSNLISQIRIFCIRSIVKVAGTVILRHLIMISG